MTSAPAQSQELQQPPQPALDEKKAEAFAQKIRNLPHDILNTTTLLEKE